jgi:hypothetical protein
MKSENLSKPVERGALCTAHNRRGAPCGKRPVSGWNVCRLHGANGGRPATRPETILRKSLESGALRDKADALIAKGADVLDLRQVAAQLQVVAGELAEKRSEGNGEVALLLQCLESLRKCAESVERIRASKAFTTAERDFIVLALSDFVETLPEEMRPRFHDFIAARLLQVKPAPPQLSITSPSM